MLEYSLVQCVISSRLPVHPYTDYNWSSSCREAKISIQSEPHATSCVMEDSHTVQTGNPSQATQSDYRGVSLPRIRMLTSADICLHMLTESGLQYFQHRYLAQLRRSQKLTTV